MSATISADGVYRYELSRSLYRLSPTAGGTCLFVMLNPSTADANTDDPTIRRCIGFAAAWDFAQFDVVNLFAYRATDPADLLRARAAGDDVVGPDNDEHIVNAHRRADRTVVAWGAKAPADRVADVVDMLGRGLYCLGTTKDGSPRHPLYVRADTDLVEWGSNA
ncbi:hypothetical protein SEA_BETTERKATZ_69 [Gordonia phage BetterKatz]|uniref:DUF1643 domain-containing protein n=1 Tax=Gordonia phage BetterKatz TaxID=1821551 RepID=A0A142KC71_9CAUD|nr:hypothetical protein BJD67_gp69 [Gordonia phage BetterKatz]AMS03704.1 hypothetical protein SEA_BETTERKATZ_69 [Gordonia phage BetterKatz]